LQRRAAVNQTEPAEVPSIVDEVLRSSGQPLEGDTRMFMESRFAHDFSRVRVHTDARAAESAQAVNALAYTVGRDVVFGAGRYEPGTIAGKTLLAHELTHTVQQEAQQSMNLQRQLKTGVAENPLESEAKQTAPEGVATEKQVSSPPANPSAKKPKVAKNPCTRTILSEGTCQFLTLNSAWVCCDPENGIKRPGKTTSKAEPGKKCPSETWTPTFTCDNNCQNALERGCDDNDNWMALPGNQFKRSNCDDVYTICANGKQTTGYVRDKSVTDTRFEVSPGIQKALGVPVGSSFLGAVYSPGAAQKAIDKDACCNS
jgi:hypothetical protein